MRKIFFPLFTVIAFFIAASCNNDKGKGDNPKDYTNDRERDKDRNNNDEKDDRNNNMDDSKASITGKWRIVDFESTDSEEMSEEEKEQMRSSYIEFMRNGSYTATTKESDGKTKKEYGTYEYDARAKTLVTIEDDGGKREELGVEFKGSDRMILTFDEGRVTMEKD